MKNLAYALMAVGVLVAVIAFNLDVTAGDTRIVNLNLMAQRQNLLIIGCVGFLAGIVLLIGALQQVNLKARLPVPEKDGNALGATSAKSALVAFWKQRDIGRKLVLASALLLLLSFCFPWEVSSINLANGPYNVRVSMIEALQAVICLLIWVYPCLTSASRLHPNKTALTINAVIAALWIVSIADGFNNMREYMATQAFQVTNGLGFWLGSLATVVLITGIVQVVRTAANQGAQHVVSEG